MAKSGASSSSPAKLDASMRIVILRGPDRYLTTAFTKKLADVLVAEHGEIEQFAFDGETVEAAVVLDELRSYGLMQQHKLVILDNADKFLTAREQDAARPAAGGRRPRTARELMERYAAEPVDSATLLLRAETWRPGKLDKAVQKIGAIIKCDAPTRARAERFCVDRCAKEHGCELDGRAASMLVDRIGTDLARLDVELGKLAAFVGEGQAIGADAVREMVGLSREEQAWAIQTALCSGSSAAAIGKLRELLYVSRQPDQFVILIMWAMTDLLRKLHAGSQLFRQGASGGAVAKQLRLWGRDGDVVLDAARRLEPDRLAQLLHQCVRADMHNKSGFGRPPRNLEVLAVQIADTMKRA